MITNFTLEDYHLYIYIYIKIFGESFQNSCYVWLYQTTLLKDYLT